MNYRIYYILTNNKIEIEEDLGFKVVLNEKQEEIDLLFNGDALNVLSEADYIAMRKQKYMYGFIIEDFTSVLKTIKNLFYYIENTFDDVLICLDSGSMRYLNQEELKYYSLNFMPIEKLFTIEVGSSEYFSVYKTQGLNTVMGEEIKMSTPKYYLEEDFQAFKKYIISNLSTGTFDLLMIREECLTVDYEEVVNTTCIYSNEYNVIQNKHLVDNYELFYKLYEKYKTSEKFKFVFNNSNEIYELPHYKDINYSNFQGKIKAYEIKYEKAVYNHINIFYATKFM